MFRHLLIAVVLCAVGCQSLREPVKAEPPRFPDLSRLRTTQQITIKDSYATLGGGHSLKVHLVRAKDEFVGEGELLSDGPSAKTWPIRVPAALVDALITEIAVRGEAPPEPKTTTLEWSDDYPSVTILLEQKGRPAVRVFYTDQKRRFKVADDTQSFILADRDGDAALFEQTRRRHQAQLHVAYERLRDALGVPW